LNCLNLIIYATRDIMKILQLATIHIFIATVNLSFSGGTEASPTSSTMTH